MIYFTISFSGNVGQNPVFIMKQTVLLWAFFLMFTKMNIQFTITIFCFMAILYIIENFIDYHSTKKADQHIVDNLKRIKGNLMILACCIVILGFSLYYRKQRKDHRSFSMIKFLFGTTHCNSYK